MQSGAIIHDQTKTESRGWGLPHWGCGCSRSTPARDGHGQVCRAGTPVLFDTSSPTTRLVRVATLASHSHTLCARGPLPTAAQYGGIPRWRFARTSLRVNRLNFSAPSSGTLRLPEHCERQFSNALEGHCQRLLVESRSNDRNRDTSSRPKSWKRQPIRTAT